MRHRWQAVAVVALISLSATSLSLSGCGKSGARSAGKAVASAGDGTGSLPRAASVGPPPSNDECRDFAKALGAAVRSGDAAALDRMIDWDALIEIAIGGIDAPEGFRKGFVNGAKESRREGNGVAQNIVDSMKQGGSYTFLRVHTKEKRPSVLFRLVPPKSSGVNYHDYVLARRPDGQVRAVDLYVFMTGELISQTLRRSFVQAAAHSSRGLLERLTGSEQEFFKHYAQLEQMARSIKGGQYREALTIYQNLPAELKKDKNALILRFQAAQQAEDDREYSQSIEDFRKEHPDDACIDILSIDYHLLKKQYPQALACIDRLDRAVGGDPYLQTFRAGIHIEQDDLEVARKDLQNAIDEEPTMKDAYWSLVTVTLLQRKFDETLKTLLSRIEKVLNLN
jgi:tetratricopeptide (TPR) repeat protein